MPAILSGQAQRPDAVSGLSLRPIDTLTRQTLGGNVALIAQPRLLAPAELVALDAWVRGGGRAMIFADPDLRWPSIYARGDRRRAPPVTLLDPLFAHWGLTLGSSDTAQRSHKLGGRTVVTVGAGQWSAKDNCQIDDGLVADCRIGKGRVLLVGDADLLNSAALGTANDNRQWIEDTIRTLQGGPRSAQPSRLPIYLAAGAIFALMIALFRIKMRT